MGGVVIILATVIGYAVANLTAGRPPNASGLLLLFLIVGLGVIGFADDYIKISRQRSLGLRARWKIIGQAFVGITFAVLALQFPNENFRTPGSTHISVVRDTGIDLAFAGAVLGLILLTLYATFLTPAWSSADDDAVALAGVATPASPMVIAAYSFIALFQPKQNRLFLADPSAA